MISNAYTTMKEYVSLLDNTTEQSIVKKYEVCFNFSNNLNECIEQLKIADENQFNQLFNKVISAYILDVLICLNNLNKANPSIVQKLQDNVKYAYHNYNFSNNVFNYLEHVKKDPSYSYDNLLIDYNELSEDDIKINNFVTVLLSKVSERISSGEFDNLNDSDIINKLSKTMISEDVPLIWDTVFNSADEVLKSQMTQ